MMAENDGIEGREKIAHPILQDLWESEFRGLDHSSWPFCDPRYSTVMPAADFTVPIRELLVAGELDAVQELLWLISDEGRIWQGQLGHIMQRFAGSSYPDSAEGRMYAEADAVAALGLRSSCHSHHNESYVISAMARSSIPIWLAENSAEAASMRQMPVGCRDMIRVGFLELEGHCEWGFVFDPFRHYGVRCFGNNAAFNLDHVWACGFFEELGIDAPAGPRVTKDIIVAEGKACGKNWLSSWKKNRLEQLARADGMLCRLRRSLHPERMRCRSDEVRDSLEHFWRWADSVWEREAGPFFESRLLNMCRGA